MKSLQLQEIKQFLNHHALKQYDGLLNELINEFQKLEYASNNELKVYLGSYIRTNFGTCKIVNIYKQENQIIVTFQNCDNKKQWLKIFNHAGHLKGYMKCFSF